MRPRIGDARAYVAPYTFGEAMSGGAVGRVAVSRHPGFAEGDWVLHMLGWRVGAIRRAPDRGRWSSDSTPVAVQWRYAEKRDALNGPS